MMDKNLEQIINTPPEAIDPSLAKSKKRRVLLLASYCGGDYDDCSELSPCSECLRMCNVAEVVVGLGDVIGQLPEAGAE